jgi:DNA-binding transcriptional MerR regulator
MMTNWYVKDLSKLTGVSVQTLHHYDRIALLKPSIRLSNGYRVYSEKDLLRLQQIVALKFFGFDLKRIKELLVIDTDALEHFSAQAELLERKAQSLLDASNVLKGVVSGVVNDKSITWESVIKLIEVYRMTQQLENSWMKEIFTPEELKQYAAFEAELKGNATPAQKAAFENKWTDLLKEISGNLNKDPDSQLGIAIGKKCMVWLNEVYGRKYAHLRTKKFEKGFAEGKGLDEVGLTPEMVLWLDKAINAYLVDRFRDILSKVGSESSSEVLKLWNDALDDLYGEDKSRQHVIYDRALADEKVSQTAKDWLKSIIKTV